MHLFMVSGVAVSLELTTLFSSLSHFICIVSRISLGHVQPVLLTLLNSIYCLVSGSYPPLIGRLCILTNAYLYLICNFLNNGSGTYLLFIQKGACAPSPSLLLLSPLPLNISLL
jgi:hypothetical protein